MTRAVPFLLAVLTAACAGAPPAPSAPRKVLLLVGGKHHEFDRVGGMIKGALEGAGRYAVTVTHDAAQLRAEAVRRYDVVALYTLRFAKNDQEAYRRIALEEQDGLAAFVRDGGPLVVLHTTIAAFDEWGGFRRILGGVWNWEGSKHDPYRDMRVRVVDPAHPIVRGLPAEFTLRDELYYNMDVDPGVHVLAQATSAESKQDSPMAWTWQYGRGRVFYTALGHGPESWESEHLKRLVVHGLAWADGR